MLLIGSLSVQLKRRAKLRQPPKSVSEHLGWTQMRNPVEGERDSGMIPNAIAQLASWIGAHVRAFEFFQGTPKLVVPVGLAGPPDPE